MAIAFNWVSDIGNGFTGANTTLTTSKGANTIASGDLLLVIVLVNGNVGAITPAAGFTLLGTQQVDGNSHTMAVFWKVAGGSETGAYTFTWTGSNFLAWSLMDLSGTSGTPIDQSGTNAIASTNFTTQSVTPSATNDFLLCGFFNDAVAFTAPAGMTINVNNVSLESGVFGYMITTLQLASSSPISETATVGAAKNGTTFIAALSPAGAGARAPTLTLVGVG